MTNLGSSSRATNPVPQNISLGRGGKGSSSQPWAPIFECPANHARVHSHKKLKKPNPLFTISLQSDGLEIKRKGEGGKITWEGRKKQSHVFYLILVFLGFFFWVELGVFLLFPALCCDFDKWWCREEIYGGSWSINTLSRAKQSPPPSSLGSHWKLFGRWSMGPRPCQGMLRGCPGWALGRCPGRRHRAGDEEWPLKPLLERKEEPSAPGGAECWMI